MMAAVVVMKMMSNADYKHDNDYGCGGGGN